MKLMIITILDEDKDKVQKQLINNGYTPTYIASTGEFLQFGKSMLMLGIKEDAVEKIEDIVKSCTKKMHIKGEEAFQAQIVVMDARVEKVNVDNKKS